MLMKKKCICEIIKILVLGTGNAQVDIIKAAKRRGLEVHSCSYKTEGRGIEFSDHFSVIDIIDIDAVKKYVVSNNIDIIYSVGSDLAMPTIAKVSKDLNLPCFVSYNTTITCKQKSKLRNALEKSEVYKVKFKELSSVEDLYNWNHFPAIVKPNDSQGQRGITEVFLNEELGDAYNFAFPYSKSKKVIIEEYVEGYEISVNTYLIKGEVKFLFITDRESFSEYPGGIIKSHKFPTNNKTNNKNVYALVKEVLNKLEINNGPAYFQLKINYTSVPIVIEVTPRFDGCHIWRLIEKLYGINLLEISIDHLLNGTVPDNTFDSLINNFKTAELRFYTAQSKNIYSDNLCIGDKNSIFDEKYYEEGDKIATMNKYAEKLGYQIIAK